MRWKTKIGPRLLGGETRTICRFAWKPTEVGERTVWLEFYEVHEQFFLPRGGRTGLWLETSRN